MRWLRYIRGHPEPRTGGICRVQGRSECLLLDSAHGDAQSVRFAMKAEDHVVAMYAFESLQTSSHPPLCSAGVWA